MSESNIDHNLLELLNKSGLSSITKLLQEHCSKNEEQGFGATNLTIDKYPQLYQAAKKASTESSII